jgi:cytochrome oxidase assembly protein ShyY1
MLRKNLLKKVVFTSLSVPMLYKTIWAWNWQAERKIEKKAMIDERIFKLSQKPLEIKDPQAEIPINSMSPEDFKKEWLYKPVRLRGIFDHSKEVMI